MPTTTTILHTRSRAHEWQGVGPLSLKTFRRGDAHYSVAGGRYLVNDTCYLILNEGQEYAIPVADRMSAFPGFPIGAN
jgi:AraC family transcriptional regulator